MKKILAICLLCIFTAVGAAAESNAVVNSETGTVKINGVSETKSGYVSVVITKPSAAEITGNNLAENSVIIYELETAEDGSFGGQFKLPADAAAGTYRVYISGEEKNVLFYYANETEILEAVDAVNNASAENIGEVLKKYTVEKEVLGLDLSGDYVQFEDTVNSVMAQEVKAAVPKTVAEIQICFEKALDAARFACGNAAAVEKAIVKNVFELDIDEKAETKDLAAMYVMLRQKNETQVQKIQKTLRSSCAVVRINAATKGEMTKVLEEYNDILNLDLEGKYKTLDKIEVNKALVNKNFTDIGKIAEAFEKSVAAVSANNKPSGGRGSSGGNGGGGVTSAIEVTNPVNRVNPPEYQETNGQDMFNDLDSEPWAKEYINILTEKGIINGKSDGIFAPQENVTREEFLKMLICALGISCEPGDVFFDDVEQGAWYEPYVTCGVNMGIVNGIDEKRFGTGENITREQMAVMTARALETQKITLKADKPYFADENDISEYAKTAVGKMQTAGIINGTPDGRFNPKAYLNRAEASKVIYFIMKAGEAGV